MGEILGHETRVRDLATIGHRLSCDDWSAWWTVDAYAFERKLTESSAIAAGCNRIEAGKRPTKSQYQAADRVFHHAIEALKNSLSK